MTVQVEFWQLVSLLLAFFGFVAGGAKVLFSQIDRRLDERFQALEDARKMADAAMQATLTRHAEEEQKVVTRLQALDRDFMQWKAELPLQYVRREDYIRNQTVIEAKLDAVALRIENWQLKGANRD
ncbi:DNA-binding transcriptional regulator YbjK [Vogesella perlucida]|nr:DNA-binding transcriptional regulator YbjK [Vogesella perlucida]